MKFGMPGSEGRAPSRRSRDPGVGGPKVRNQCAVRMSVALCRSMNADIFGADDDKCRHIASSETLFNYLRETLNFTFEPIGTNYSLIPQPGIIFFRTSVDFAQVWVTTSITGMDGPILTRSAEPVDHPAT